MIDVTTTIEELFISKVGDNSGSRAFFEGIKEQSGEKGLSNLVEMDLVEDFVNSAVEFYNKFI